MDVARRALIASTRITFYQMAVCCVHGSRKKGKLNVLYRYKSEFEEVFRSMKLSGVWKFALFIENLLR